MKPFSESIRRAVIAACVALAPLAASAHPGHLDQPVHGVAQAIAHLLSEPDHLAMIAAAVAIGLLARRITRRGRGEAEGLARRDPDTDHRPRSR